MRSATVWRIPKLILKACTIRFDALNYISIFQLCLLKVTWSIENLKQQLIRNKTFIALLMNRLTFYSEK